MCQTEWSPSPSRLSQCKKWRLAKARFPFSITFFWLGITIQQMPVLHLKGCNNSWIRMDSERSYVSKTSLSFHDYLLTTVVARGRGAWWPNTLPDPVSPGEGKGTWENQEGWWRTESLLLQRSMYNLCAYMGHVSQPSKWLMCVSKPQIHLLSQDYPRDLRGSHDS